MVLPLLLGLGIGSLVASAGANLYAQKNQRDIYRHERDANNALAQGYNRYLESQGRVANPNRAWSSYEGAAYRASKNIASSYAGSIGTVAGTIGAGTRIGGRSGLFDDLSLGQIYRRL